MTAFNLTDALNGSEVVTRDGQIVNALRQTRGGALIGEIDCEEFVWHSTGEYCNIDRAHPLDLFMKS